MSKTKVRLEDLKVVIQANEAEQKQEEFDARIEELFDSLDFDFRNQLGHVTRLEGKGEHKNDMIETGKQFRKLQKEHQLRWNNVANHPKVRAFAARVDEKVDNVTKYGYIDENDEIVQEMNEFYKGVVALARKKACEPIAVELRNMEQMPDLDACVQAFDTYKKNQKQHNTKG